MATSQACAAVSYKTILLATDFLSSSEAALPYVLSLARSFDSSVLVASAVPFQKLGGFAAVPPIVDVDFGWEDAIEAMQVFKDKHPFAGVRHEFLLERGDPREVIANLVQNRAVDLVVVGSHGRHGLHKLLIGSVAEQIFRTVRCPVLTIGPKVEPSLGESWQPRRILFATEFAEGSIHALPHALAVADANHGELLVLYAIPLVLFEKQSEMYRQFRQRLEDLISEQPPHICTVKSEVCFDLPAQGILDTARKREVGLIVMGVHHAHFARMGAHVPGSIACEVIDNAPCPVLTVRN